MELPSELKPLLRLSLPEQKAVLAELQKRRRYSESRRRLWRYYPDSGPLCRAAYPRHMEFFAAGAECDERAFIAANRTGKSTCVAYEAVLHLIGQYPEWWVGRRYARPCVAWVAGVDVKSMRESMQPLLFGVAGQIGTGMIPGDSLIGNPTSQRGTADAIDTAQVRHSSGGISRLTLKTYEQGRESFQAAKVDVGVCDEEPPKTIYTEFLTRLMSTVPGERNGTMMCSFTPLAGMSEVVMDFLGEDWRRPEEAFT